MVDEKGDSEEEGAVLGNFFENKLPYNNIRMVRCMAAGCGKVWASKAE